MKQKKEYIPKAQFANKSEVGFVAGMFVVIAIFTILILEQLKII